MSSQSVSVASYIHSRKPDEKPASANGHSLPSTVCSSQSAFCSLSAAEKLPSSASHDTYTPNSQVSCKKKSIQNYKFLYYKLRQAQVTFFHSDNIEKKVVKVVAFIRENKKEKTLTFGLFEKGHLLF